MQSVQTEANRFPTPDARAHSGSAIPGSVRRAIFLAIGLLSVGAAYLIAVRGDAILADIASAGAKAWCF